MENSPLTEPRPLTSSPLAAADPRLRFAKAVALAGAVLDGVRPEQQTDPTPCDAMDVAALEQHFVEVLRRVAALGRGDDPFALSALDPSDDVRESWAAAAHAVQEAWTDDEVLERRFTLPWAELSGTGILGMYTSELTTHTWDLAMATGQSPAWDDDVLTVAFESIRRDLPSAGRQARFAESAQAMPENRRAFPPPFADAVAVPDDAPLIDRLVAWTGRPPGWRRA
ncbi:MAG TPA: TIGR03086 family metal-binding protein [Acidimicrobiales bacterium]|nr:TIGR03086 family metal-binding protein [Acidimicrobiales bacterium]